MIRSHTRSALTAIGLALGLLAVACGDDTSPIQTGEDPAAEASYLDDIRTIAGETDPVIRDAFEAAFVEMEGLAFETMLPRLGEVLGMAISTQEAAIDRYETIDAPRAFAADHERGIRFLQDQVELWGRQQAAAEASDAVLFNEIDLELQSLTREVLTDLSPEFVDAFATDRETVAIAAALSGIRDAEADYLDAVAQGWDEFGRRARDFQAAVNQTYASDQLLLDALLRAGAGEAFAAARDAIVEIEPPASSRDAHSRLLDYLDEAVALDTVIADAARAGDIVAFEVADYGLSLAAARFVLDSPPALAAIIGEAEVLVRPEDLPGGAYGEDLWEALKRFQVLALRRQVESGVFPVVSEDNLAKAMAETLPTVIELTEAAISDIEALGPPAGYEAGHERLLTYLTDLMALRRSVLEAAETGDLDTLREKGELGGLAAERAETKLWCSTLADLSGDPIEPITATFFLPFDSPTIESLCPDPGG